MKYYGIDLGNGTCSISQVDNDKSVKVLKDKDGKMRVKSKIAFKDLQNVIVGEEYIEDENIDSIDIIKSKFGVEKKVKVQGQQRSIQYCGAILLRYLMKSRLSTERLNKAVITIPAIYGQVERRIIKDIAEQAGVEKVELIEEPIAAAIYYLYDEYNLEKKYLEKNEHILVFDFGAGTLDMALIEVSSNEEGVKANVKYQDGCKNCGGDLIDMALAQYILGIYFEEFDCEELEELVEILETYIDKYSNSKYEYIDFIDKKIKKKLEKIIVYAEKIKILLTIQESVKVKFEDLDEFIIEKKVFDRDVMNNYIKTKIERPINTFLSSKDFNIETIVMVGGTSQIPYIEKYIKEKFADIRVVKKEEYINAVSLGAAIVSALNEKVKIDPFGKNKSKGLISNNIYIDFNGKRNLIIKKGTAYPCANKYKFKIPYSLCESIKIKIEEEIKGGNKNIVNILKFYHPCFYTGDEIEVLCEIDEKGIIYFEAEHMETKENISIELENEKYLSEKQISAGRSDLDKNLMIM